MTAYTPEQQATYDQVYSRQIALGFSHAAADACARGRVMGFIPTRRASKVGALDHVSVVDVLRADELTVETVRWLWHGYLPAGKLTLIAGPAGTSKTTLAIAIAATITQAGRWPDGTRADIGDAVVWSGEDGVADTLLPRSIVHGADLSRLHFVGDVTSNGERRSFDPATDMPALELAASRIDELRLVIVDPVILTVGRGDSNKGGDVRRGLSPLIKLAETTGAAVVGITHFSKGTAGKHPIERVTGSLAFAAAARVVLAVARIPDDQGGGRVVLRAKNNLGPDEGGFRFDIQTVDAAGAEAVRIVWGEAITGSAHDILTQAERQDDPDERKAADAVVEFLRECLLEAGGSMERRDLLAAARRNGYAERTLERARDRLGVTVRTSGFGKAKHSIWTLTAQSRQTSTTQSKVIIDGNGGIDGNGEEPLAPIPSLAPISTSTRESDGNGEASVYLRASRGE